MLTLEKRTALIVASKLSCAQGGAAKFGNNSNLNVHLGFFLLGSDCLLLDFSVWECMFAVLPLGSGQCLLGLQIHIFV